MHNNRSRKVDGIKEPLELHKEILQKNSNGNYFPFGSCCQPWLMQAFLPLVAWNSGMMLFWTRSGKRTRSLFASPLNGRDSLLLFWFALLYSPSPVLLGQIISSPTTFFFPFAFLDKNFRSPIPLLFSLGQKFSKSNINSANFFYDNSKFCLSRRIIPISQKYSKSPFRSDLEKFTLSAYKFYTFASGV